MSNSSTIVQRVWNYCNVLRDDGVSYGDYPGQPVGRSIRAGGRMCQARSADASPYNHGRSWMTGEAPG